jgi:hypothetical protein
MARKLGDGSQIDHLPEREIRCCERLGLIGLVTDMPVSDARKERVKLSAAFLKPMIGMSRIVVFVRWQNERDVTPHGRRKK